MTGRNQTGSWWCKQAKLLTRPRSSKRMQHLQGLCVNLINALTLLANQQDDGDGLVQNIVTNLGEVGRKELAEGLRNLIHVDNHRALEVGHLREGLRSFKVRRPKGEEGYPEVPVRESPDELTFGAEETGTWKSCTNVNHIAKGRWSPPLVDADWHAFCQVFLWHRRRRLGRVVRLLQRNEQDCGCKEATGGPEIEKPSGK